MPKIKYWISLLVGILFIFMAAIHVFNYNIHYYNWTYQANPISRTKIVGFENTQDCTGELNAIKSAALTWNNLPANFSFPRISKGKISNFHGIDHSDNENQIGWLQSWPAAYDPNALAVTSLWLDAPPSNRILAVDTVLNDYKVFDVDVEWSTDATVPGGKYDVESCMLHEFGHWAGLRHTVSPYIMYPILGMGVPQRAIMSDDADGLFRIYNLLGWEGSRLTNTADWSIEPAIAVGKDLPGTPSNPGSPEAEGNIIHSAWSDKRSGNFEIYYRRHSTGGNNNIQWESEQRITSNAGASVVPDIAANKIKIGENTFSKHVYLVWCDNSGGNNDIYFRRSVDGGTTWEPTITNLSNNPGDSISPAIAVSIDNAIHVVWTDNTPGISIGNVYNYEIYYAKYTTADGWSLPLRLTNKSHLSNMFALSDHPDIAADYDGNVHIVWRDNRLWAAENIEIFYKRSQNGPNPWTDDFRLTTSIGGGGCFQPSIAIADLHANQTIHVVYTCEMPDTLNGDILYKKSMDGGTSWEGATNLSSNSGYSNGPEIGVGYIVHGTNKRYAIHVAWRDDTPGQEDVFYCYSATAGADGETWKQYQLTSNQRNCYGVSLAVYEYNIHILWSQIIAPETDYEIHYLRNRARL